MRISDWSSDVCSSDPPAVASKLVPDLTFWDREDVLLGSPPVPGSLEAASSLHEAGLLSCYITRRTLHVAELTLRWLQENKFPDVPVEHVGSRNADEYFKVCKSSVCEIGRAHV